MKFKNEEEKMAALKKACLDWGASVGNAKFAELTISEIARGYVDETPSQRMEKRLPDVTTTEAPQSEATGTPAQEEEKKKRIRRTKEQIAADEAAAKTAQAAPAVPAPAPAPVAAPAPASTAAPVAAPAPVITQKMVQELMGSLLILLGNTPESRPRIVSLLKEATGKTKTAELTTPEDLKKAYDKFTGEKTKIESQSAAQDEVGDAL